MKAHKNSKKKTVSYTKTAVLIGLLIVLLILIINGILLLAEFFSKKETVETGVKVQVTETDEDVSKTPETIVPAKTETESETETETAAEEPDTLKVILDAGHGGNDGGTLSGKLLEKTINLDIVMKMKPLLEELGIEVFLTRTEDDYMGLDERAIAANQAGGDLFVSIHCNYYKEGSSISGVECYYYDNAVEGKKCAETILDELKTGGKIAGRNAKEQDYYVLKNTSMPAVLIEVGYLSSQTDRLNLGSKKYKQTMAEELVRGICTYLESAETE